MRILDPRSGETVVIDLAEYRRATKAAVQTYEQKVEVLSQGILKALGLDFVLTDRDPGDERDVGC